MTHHFLFSSRKVRDSRCRCVHVICCAVLWCGALYLLYRSTHCFSAFRKFLKHQCCTSEVLLAALAWMLVYLQANNRKTTPQDNKMQTNKSSYKNHSQKIETSHPVRLGYKNQSKYTKIKSPYPTGVKGHKESKPFGSY